MLHLLFNLFIAWFSYVDSWTVDNKLKTLEFAREKNVYCYFCAAAMIFPPELHEARITWAKYSILTAKVDDFFDNGGSMEELLNLIQLFKKYLFSLSAPYFCQSSFIKRSMIMILTGG